MSLVNCQLLNVTKLLIAQPRLTRLLIKVWVGGEDEVDDVGYEISDDWDQVDVLGNDGEWPNDER